MAIILSVSMSGAASATARREEAGALREQTFISQKLLSRISQQMYYWLKNKKKIMKRKLLSIFVYKQRINIHFVLKTNKKIKRKDEIWEITSLIQISTVHMVILQCLHFNGERCRILDMKIKRVTRMLLWRVCVDSIFLF